MSRPAGQLLLAGALGLAVVTLALVAVLRPAEPLSRAAQVEAIASELRCPTCQALSVADSPSGAAAEMRRQIGALLAEGRRPDEVKQHFVDRYGEWILLAPTSPAAWVVPVLITVAALAGLAVWLRRRPAAGGAAEAPDSSPRRAEDRYRERVRDELEALDA